VMTDPVKLLLSGPGLIGRKHVDLIAENPETQLVGIVAPDHEHNFEYAQQHGVKLYHHLGEALAQLSVDGAIISSPNAFHFDQTQVCVEHDVPVLVEKPLTDCLETAAKLVKLSEDKKVPVLVGHHRTYSPLLAAAHQFVTSEAFGEAVCLQGSALFYKPDDYFLAGPWRTKIGGGPILINMIHEIGIMRFIFGDIESVTARITSKTRGFEVEDSVAVTLGFQCGAIGTFLLSDASASSKSWEMTAGENPAYPHFPTQDCYHFSGTMGSLDFPSMRYRTYLENSVQSWWLPFVEGSVPFQPQDPLKLQLAHFVDVVRGRAVPLVSARDGYLNMVVLEAIVKAAKTGSEVKVSEIL
jgi:predicted dehydrogenase